MDEINIAATFGFTTLFATVALASASSAGFGVHFIRKVITTRDKIKNLRRQYVW